MSPRTAIDKHGGPRYEPPARAAMISDDDEPEGAADEPERGEGDRKGRFEGAISHAIKRAVEKAVETGMGRLAEGPEKIGHLMGELKLPKEVLSHLYAQ